MTEAGAKDQLSRFAPNRRQVCDSSLAWLRLTAGSLSSEEVASRKQSDEQPRADDDELCGGNAGIE